jgi:hypothetical protein
MQRKIIEMLASTKTDQATYTAGEIYSVVADVADRLVREKLAKYIDVTLDEEEDEPAESESRPSSGKPWRETIQPGDIFQWQITLNLPHFDKPRIKPEFHPDETFYLDAKEINGIKEVGGDGPKPSEPQAAAIDYLAAHELELYEKILKAIADYAQEFRSDWEENSPELAAKVLPGKPEDVADRISFAHVSISPRTKDGIAYIEIAGNCTWDAEHGFCAVLHRDRIVDLSQQGSGWADEKA